MKTVPSISMALAATLLFFFFLGCINDNSIDPGESKSAVVIGTVVAIEDLVPVDGGVSIDLESLDGRSERLLFASLFTNPPPSEDRQQLYQVILRVDIGSVVRAEGTRTEKGIEIERLTILSK